jgi:hypothetical protein
LVKKTSIPLISSLSTKEKIAGKLLEVQSKKNTSTITTYLMTEQEMVFHKTSAAVPVIQSPTNITKKKKKVE